jgi:prevent-host-death family protein
VRRVGVRQLKDRLSHYLRQTRKGEEILVTDRGEAVACLRPAPAAGATGRSLTDLVRRGLVVRGGKNRPQLYPRLKRLTRKVTSAELLQAERGER